MGMAVSGEVHKFGSVELCIGLHCGHRLEVPSGLYACIFPHKKTMNSRYCYSSLRKGPLYLFFFLGIKIPFLFTCFPNFTSVTFFNSWRRKFILFSL